jgi:predicted phage tail protein
MQRRNWQRPGRRARPDLRARARLAPATLRGSAFGLLATVQAGANLAASALAGILWTAVSPAAAFLFLTAAMILAVPLIMASGRIRPSSPQAEHPVEPPS